MGLALPIPKRIIAFADNIATRISADPEDQAKLLSYVFLGDPADDSRIKAIAQGKDSTSKVHIDNAIYIIKEKIKGHLRPFPRIDLTEDDFLELCADYFQHMRRSSMGFGELLDYESLGRLSPAGYSPRVERFVLGRHCPRGIVEMLPLCYKIDENSYACLFLSADIHNQVSLCGMVSLFGCFNGVATYLSSAYKRAMQFVAQASVRLAASAPAALTLKDHAVREAIIRFLQSDAKGLQPSDELDVAGADEESRFFLRNLFASLDSLRSHSQPNQAVEKGKNSSRADSMAYAIVRAQ